MVCVGPFCFNVFHLLLVLALVYKYVQSYLQGRGKILGGSTPSSGPCRTNNYTGEGGRELKLTQGKNNQVSPYKHDVKSWADLKRTLEDFQSKYPHLDSTRDRRVIVKFSAAWCKPCKMVEPVLENLRYSCKAAFVHIDVDNATDNITDGIQSLPTFRILEWKALASTELSAIKDYKVLGTHRGSGGVERFVESACEGFDSS
eukprot:Gregarina_sp_Pseudo_9__1403@NODE_1939_length_1241_cov_374_720466_g1797_i0_p1_GENE_NODE_1939_length_1241_cov_374_720466_g1797_i0NODE_1939_length_1241_cov_374_720466_g1797_i0_p1_ORF_typecomplete_len202_score30_43Thioredoxin/PF00085_20/1_8e03Thioredoxin/PF00085_20/1_5e11Thioredoxin_8/PF13905_6/1_3e04Thioredoxin_8/PF13905_6/4e05AhpCTSA/PF00578_21/0_00023TraF/PF13728_6/0_0023Redoxin/PF08534_10/0_0031Thioredoxin_7/PF13899_6/0_0076Glutaredoxin/PF00462_24/0_024Thioredoxin_2/PF13098_6/0_023Thioredoxin_9/